MASKLHALLTLAGCVALLGMASTPGGLEVAVSSFPGALGLLLLEVVWIGATLWLLVRAGSRWRGSGRREMAWVVLAGLCALTAAWLAHASWLQHIPLAACRGELEKHAVSAPVTRVVFEPRPLRIGGCSIEQFSADPRGGVYFVVQTGPDGLGPDYFSYGFAFRPNNKGSPYGNAAYELHHLSGDWYSFAASNDW